MLQKDRLDAPHIVNILDVVDECQDVRTFTIDYPHRVMPGQFVMVWVPNVDEIPMSISLMEDEKQAITVKRIGYATKAMHNLEKGDRIGIRGPYGTSYEREGKEKLLVVAGGIGIAPLAPFIENSAREGCEITLVLGAKTESELLFADRLKDVSHLHISTDDGSSGYHGFASDLGDEILAKEKFHAIYTCGPEPMMKKVVDTAMKLKIPVQASLERFMKCGVGLCDSCALNGVQVCKDGPVFTGQELEKLSDFGTLKRDACGLDMWI